MPEPIQLRGTPTSSPLLVIRGGEFSLTDENLVRASGLTRAKWGFDGISVFEAPGGNIEELANRIQALAERPRIRTASGDALRHAGFPLLDTAGELHWTIVLANTSHATLDRLRSVFSPAFDNPGYKRRQPR